MLNTLLEHMLQLSLQAAAVAVFVLILRAVFGVALTARWRHALWLLVLLRLLIPILPESRVSIFTVAHLLRNPQSTLDVVDLPRLDEPQPVHISVQYDFRPITGAVAHSTLPTIATTPFWQQPAIIAAIWLVIAIAIMARLIVTNLLFARRFRHGNYPVPGNLVAILDLCRQEMNLSRCPVLIITDSVDAPAVSGVIPPRVLLPIYLAKTLSDAQLRLVFLHELAHIKCQDVAMDWLLAIVQSLHWFNPMLWIIAPLRRSDRELARDEMVLNVTGSSQSENYGKTLLQLAQAARLPIFCPGLVGIVSGKRRLARRIKLIASFNGRRTVAGWVGAALISIAAGCALTNPRSAEQPTTAPVAVTKPSTATISATTEAVDDSVIETRSYDVNDLMFTPQDYGLPGEAHWQPDNKQDTERKRAARIQDIKTYIENNVASSSWKEQGGNVGKIAVRGSRPMLLISQTHNHQQEIQDALDSLRKSNGQQISVETRLLMIDESTVGTLSQPMRQRLAALSGAGKSRTDQLLSDDEVNQLVKTASASPSTISLAAPRLTMFNGQHALLVIQTQQAYVDSLTKITGKKDGHDETIYDPHVATTTTKGVTLKLLACESPDRGRAFVDLDLKYARLLALVPRPWPNTPTNVQATYQQPVTVLYEKLAACAIPDHKTLLLSGFTQIISSTAPDHSTLLLSVITHMIQDTKGSTTQPIQDAEIDKAIEQERHKRVYLLITPTMLSQQKG